MWLIGRIVVLPFVIKAHCTSSLVSHRASSLLADFDVAIHINFPLVWSSVERVDGWHAAIAWGWLLHLVLPLDHVNIGFGLCFIEHWDEATHLVDVGSLAIQTKFFSLVNYLPSECVVDSNLVIGESADEELFAVVNLEREELAEALSLWPNSNDVELTNQINDHDQVVWLRKGHAHLVLLEGS